MAKEPIIAEIAAESQPAPATRDPHYKQIQAAHEGYFKDINDMCAQTQRQYQLIQMEYERSMENAFQKQDQDAWRAATDEYQRALEAACSDTSAIGGCTDAYGKYKAAIKDVMASTNMDEMNFTDMANLSQSMFAISQMAMRLSCAQPAATNNPFE